MNHKYINTAFHSYFVIWKWIKVYVTFSILKKTIMKECKFSNPLSQVHINQFNWFFLCRSKHDSWGPQGQTTCTSSSDEEPCKDSAYALWPRSWPRLPMWGRKDTASLWRSAWWWVGEILEKFERSRSNSALCFQKDLLRFTCKYWPTQFVQHIIMASCDHCAVSLSPSLTYFLNWKALPLLLVLWIILPIFWIQHRLIKWITNIEEK